MHGCELFKHPWTILSCMAVSFSKHPWNNLSCTTVVSFSNISGDSICWLSAFRPSLAQPILHGCQLVNDSGTTYPALRSAFQTSLEQPILHGCELFNHLWNDLSCMAVSFSIIPVASFPAWLSALQPSPGHPILNGCESQPSLERTSYLAWLRHGSEHFNHLWDIQSCVGVSFSTISGTTYPAWP